MYVIFGLHHWGSLGVPTQTAVPVTHVRIQSSLGSLLTGSRVECMMHVTHHCFALKSELTWLMVTFLLYHCWKCLLKVTKFRSGFDIYCHSEKARMVLLRLGFYMTRKQARTQWWKVKKKKKKVLFNQLKLAVLLDCMKALAPAEGVGFCTFTSPAGRRGDLKQAGKTPETLQCW